MIGVILWSDAADQKAVIWCEDHGDLAFLADPEAIELPDRFFDVGDIVQFDILASRNTRLAKNAVLLPHSVGTQLRDTLKTFDVSTAATDSARIIPFRTTHPAQDTVHAPVKFARTVSGTEKSGRN